MPTYRPLTDIPISLFTNSSTQASGYVLRAYLTGTSTPTTLYSDSAGTSAGTSVTLDARGEFTTIKRVWIDTAVNYKLRYETDAGLEVWTVDPVYGSPVGVSVTATGTSTARTLAERYTDIYNVKDFGAIGDGAVDDTAALQAAFDYVATLGDSAVVTPYRRSGSTLYFPNGTYRTTAPIVLSAAVYKVVGAGRFKSYPQVFEPIADCLPTIMPVHTGRNVFTISPGSQEVSFHFSGVNIATLETGNRPTAAFGFDCTGSEFQRDLTLDYVGISGFTSAIDVYGATGVQAIGTLKVQNCSISRNANIVRCLDNTYINIFSFCHNEAGQNTGGIQVRGSNVDIYNNSLESIANAITISGTFKGGRISNNYFEANTGSYVIYLNSTNGMYIGENSYESVSATEKIRLQYDVNTTVNEGDVIPNCDGSWNVKTRDNAFTHKQIGATTSHGATLALVYDGSQKLDALPPLVTEFGSFSQLETTYTSASTGLVDHSASGLSIAQNSWLGVSYLVSYEDEPVETPALYLRPNTTDTDGQIVGFFYEFDVAPVGVKGRTILYWGVTKALQTVTSMQSFLYPFGISPAAGLVCKYSGPCYYNFGTAPPENAFRAFALHRQVVQEHGTFTPAYVSSGGSFATMTMDNYATCYWTRVGKIVFINALFRTDVVDNSGASGSVNVTGLPFAVLGNMPCVVGRSEGFVNAPVVGQFVAGTTTISLFKRATATGSTATLAVADLTNGASSNANDIQIVGWYITND